MCPHSGSGNVDRTLTQATMLKDGYSPGWFGRPLSMALRPSSSPLKEDEARRTPPRFFKAATGSESSGDEFAILEEDSASTQESSSDATSCTSWFSPAAHRRAPQISHTFLTQKPTCVPFAQRPDASWASSRSSRPWRQESE